MNKLKQNILPLCCFVIGLLFLVSYQLFFEEQVNNILNGHASSWANSLINWLYPRFTVEIHRFSSSFFLSKTQAVFTRGACVFFLISLVSALIINVSTISEKWNSFWSQSTSSTTINYLNKIYLAFLMYFTWDLAFDLYELQAAAKFFYQPVFILKVFQINFPPLWLSSILLLVFYGCMVWSFVNKQRKWTVSLVALLFIYFESLLNSFGKVDHGLSTYIYGGIGLVFINWTNQNKTNKLKWPVLLTQLWICLCYLLAGIEKITTSGIDSLLNDSLQNFLLAHNSTLGLWLADYNFVCSLLMGLTLVLQLGFISVLFNRKLIFPFIVLGICFHWGTTLFLGINQFINPWIVSYLFFINWEKLDLFISKKRGQ